MPIRGLIAKGGKIFPFVKRRRLEEDEKRRLIIENIIKELSKFSNEDLEKIVDFVKTAKSSKFINKVSNENLKKIAYIAENVKSVQEKDASAIFDFISKAPKRKLETIAILAGIARSIREVDVIKKPPENVVRFGEYVEAQKILSRLAGLKSLVEKGEAPQGRDIAEIKKEVEKMGLFSGIAKIASRTDGIKRIDIEDIERIIRTHEGEEGEIYGEEIVHRGEGREIPEEIAIPFQKGVMLLKAGGNNAAYDYFNEIILNNQNLKSAWINKGVAAGGLGKTLDDGTPEEIECYKKALEIDENYIKAISNLVIAYRSIGNFAEADKYLDEYVEKLKGRGR